MIIESLTLKNFRNHNYLSFKFKKGLNLLVGPNAAGKTNIAEAIYYLSLGKSFKTSEEDNLIQKGKDNAQIESVITQGELRRKVNISLFKESKKILINNKPISKLSELSNVVNVILFEPKDVLLFRGSPKDRRNFLDISISKKCLPYLEYMSNYDRVLKERNEILKADKIDQNLLDATTEMLVKYSGPIVSYRTQYCKDIQDILIKITRALTGVRNEIEIIYKPFVDFDLDFQSKALAVFKENLDKDIHAKATTIGIHREDFQILLNGKNIAEYGSQGENRLIALALKLSPYFLIEEREKRPVVVLDDVMSELDQGHRQRLVEMLKKFEQVFITATRLEISGSSQYQIKKKTKEVF